jgi:hypothetical protein
MVERCTHENRRAYEERLYRQHPYILFTSFVVVVILAVIVAFAR